MNSDLESAGQREWALTDWVSIAGLLIFGAFICFSIVLFGKAANHSANQTQAVVEASTPAAGLESRPGSTPEASAQSVVAAVTEPQTRSEPAPSSTPSLGQAVSSPLQPPSARLEREKSAITDANAIGKHRTNALMGRQSNRRRSVLDKFVSKSVNTLVGLWRHTFKANK